MWLETQPDGREGVIGFIMPGSNLTLQTMQSPDKELALRMSDLARDHQRVSGHPVRLAHLVEVE
jgi:hypothetical protein